MREELEPVKSFLHDSDSAITANTIRERTEYDHSSDPEMLRGFNELFNYVKAREARDKYDISLPYNFNPNTKLYYEKEREEEQLKNFPENGGDRFD